MHIRLILRNVQIRAAAARTAGDTPIPPAAGEIKMPKKWARKNICISENQRLRLLDLRQRLHLGEHLRGNGAVDLEQRNGSDAMPDAAEMEGGDVDPGIAEQAGEVADKAGLVLVGDVDHRLAELGIDPDAPGIDPT